MWLIVSLQHFSAALSSVSVRVRALHAAVAALSVTDGATFPRSWLETALRLAVVRRPPAGTLAAAWIGSNQLKWRVSYCAPYAAPCVVGRRHLDPHIQGHAGAGLPANPR